jgi:hypothetical protein
MENITMTKEGNTLIVKIDLAKNMGPSRTGKTMVIASTQGNISVPGDPAIKLGVNCYKTR